MVLQHMLPNALASQKDIISNKNVWLLNPKIKRKSDQKISMMRTNLVTGFKTKKANNL